MYCLQDLQEVGKEANSLAQLYDCLHERLDFARDGWQGHISCTKCFVDEVTAFCAFLSLAFAVNADVLLLVLLLSLLLWMQVCLSRAEV